MMEIFFSLVKTEVTFAAEIIQSHFMPEESSGLTTMLMLFSLSVTVSQNSLGR